MANEIQETILKAILSDDKRRLFYATEKTKDEYFSDEYSDLWKIIQRVHDVTRELVDAPTLEKVLSRSKLSAERIVQVEELWRRLVERPPVSESDFKQSIALLLEDYETLMMGEAFTDALEILSRGKKDEKTGVILEGPDDALSHFRSRLAAFEGVNMEDLPEFNIREQELELLAELHESNSMNRLATGIRPFDEMTNGGIAPGEMMFIAAGSGVGKSITCTSIAHHVMSQGKNVIYFTTETLFKQIRHRVLIKHTRDFIPGGVSSTGVKKHSTEEPYLTEEEIEAYTIAVKDFSQNEGYGKLIVVQIPKGTPFGSLEAKLERWQQECDIDLCIIDSPDMLDADVRFTEERHILNWVINAVKGLAISFKGGKGIPIICPWQINRSGQKDVAGTGRYHKSDLAESAMAERRCDIILALLEIAETAAKLKAQMLKVRDSAGVDFMLEADLDHYYIGSDESLEAADAMDIAGLM